MSRRAMLGAGVIVAWLAGIALLIQREYFRPQVERLADAAARVTPGAVYYGVMQGSQQIGFASSTIDTAETAITVVDYLIVDLPAGDKPRRATMRTTVNLSRALRMQKFEVAGDAAGAPVHATGDVEGDSALVVGVSSDSGAKQTRRVPLAGPILLPTLVPLAVALGERPTVGKHYRLPIFDLTSMALKNVTFDVRAESLFVVNDSAVYDVATERWRGTQPDTVHAWQVAAQTPGGFTGWVDEQGRVVQTTQMGFVLHRLPYEVAFENWQADSGRVAPPAAGKLSTPH